MQDVTEIVEEAVETSEPAAPKSIQIPQLKSKSEALRVARKLLGPLVRFQGSLENGGVTLLVVTNGKVADALSPILPTYEAALQHVIDDIVNNPERPLHPGIITTPNINHVEHQRKAILEFIPGAVKEEHRLSATQAIQKMKSHEITTIGGLLSRSDKGTEQERIEIAIKINDILTFASNRR